MGARVVNRLSNTHGMGAMVVNRLSNTHGYLEV